jgi:HSP20 family protein
MLSVRLNPWNDMYRELNRMREELEEFFGARTNGRRAPQEAFPPLNVWEDDTCFYVEAELPGLALEDLELSLTNDNTLVLRGERKEPQPGQGQWLRRERTYGRFERTVTLPGPVNADQVEASFKHGVLTVRLPKAPELLPRKIEVKGG